MNNKQKERENKLTGMNRTFEIRTNNGIFSAHGNSRIPIILRGKGMVEVLDKHPADLRPGEYLGLNERVISVCELQRKEIRNEVVRKLPEAKKTSVLEVLQRESILRDIGTDLFAPFIVSEREVRSDTLAADIFCKLGYGKYDETHARIRRMAMDAGIELNIPTRTDASVSGATRYIEMMDSGELDRWFDVNAGSVRSFFELWAGYNNATSPLLDYYIYLKSMKSSRRVLDEKDLVHRVLASRNYMTVLTVRSWFDIVYPDPRAFTRVLGFGSIKPKDIDPPTNLYSTETSLDARVMLARELLKGSLPEAARNTCLVTNIGRAEILNELGLTEFVNSLVKAFENGFPKAPNEIRKPIVEYMKNMAEFVLHLDLHMKAEESRGQDDKDN